MTNAKSDIYHLSTTIQLKAIQIEHLVGTALDSIDPFDTEDASPTSVAERRANGERVAAMLPLAIEVAREIAALAEQIEKAGIEKVEI